MQIHIPYLLECLNLLKDYNEHLLNSLRPLFFLPAIWQQLAVVVALCLMTGNNIHKIVNTYNNLRNGQNHASVSCTKQFHKQKCRFSFLRFSPEGRPVKMQVSTSLPGLDVDIR
jgi:hypothetical protein